MTKTCAKCRAEKSVERFCKNRRSKDGLNIYCRDCAHAQNAEWRRAHPDIVQKMARRFYLSSKAQGYRPAYNRRANLKRNYGLTEHQYEAMVAEQHGRCAICGEVETHVRRGKVVRLAVDHEHGTGKVRGLLCARCNRAIGLMRENKVTLASAIEYLKRPAIRLVADQ